MSSFYHWRGGEWSIW